MVTTMYNNNYYSCLIIRFLNISPKYDEKIYLFQSVLSSLCLNKFPFLAMDLRFLAFSTGNIELCLVTVRGTGIEENQPIESLDKSCPIQIWPAILKNINFAFRKMR